MTPTTHRKINTILSIMIITLLSILFIIVLKSELGCKLRYNEVEIRLENNEQDIFRVQSNMPMEDNNGN